MNNIQKQIATYAEKRGVIPSIPLPELNQAFLAKLKEEVNELESALITTGKIDAIELADCFIVIANCATWNDIDLIKTALTKAANDVNRKPKDIIQ